jgi:hypothetical protein
MREWKPGDVQVVLSMHPSRVQEFAEWLRSQAKTPSARLLDYAEQIADQGHGARLACIDPADREQVERLWRAWCDLAPDHRLAQDNMQAALREYADPTPKCGARLSLDYGEEGSHHECDEPAGHDGAHSGAGLLWMTGVTEDGAS